MSKGTLMHDVDDYNDDNNDNDGDDLAITIAQFFLEQTS